MKQCQTTWYFGELIPTYLKERSFFGYTPHVLKSGIQKYARRAEIDKGLWCLIEMDLFSLLEWDGLTLEAYLKAYPKETRSNVMQSARRLRTNMFNRLVALMSEEVNVSAWWMPKKVRELYQRWCSNRGNPDSRKYLYDTYLYLTSQRMIRLISDLKSVYILPPYYVKNEQMNDFMKIHRGIRAFYPAVFANQSSVGDIDWDLNGYPANLRPCIKGIIYNLEACSDNAFYWISRLCSLEKEAGVTQYRYQKLVGKLMHDFIDRHSEYHFLRESISAGLDHRFGQQLIAACAPVFRAGQLRQAKSQTFPLAWFRKIVRRLWFRPGA